MFATTSHVVLPRLRPDGVSWRMAGNLLEVDLDLANESSEPTEAGDLVIEAAALGAFVPFVPVARVRVAAFEPFERRRTRVALPQGLLRLASIAKVPALQERAFGQEDLLRFYKLVDSGRWAGNLNIYFHRAPEQGVEVHRALEVKVEARHKVSFYFLLGTGDEYELIATPSDPAWLAEVHGPLPGHGVLIIGPPAAIGARATVAVRVTRVSDGKTVPVVFGFETVASHGESIGCVSL
jgi:hypothetical protein